MDEKSIRGIIEGIAEELRVLEARREKLIDARKGLEALITLESGNGVTPRKLFEMPRDPTTPARYETKGLKSMRSAVRQVMAESHGKEDLHSKIVLQRAYSLGATTAAKDPPAIVDLMLYSLKKSGAPVEKVAPRTWRWTGD